MNDDQDKLLNEVFAVPGGYDSLRTIRKAARNRRWRRYAERSCLVLVVFITAGAFIRQLSSDKGDRESAEIPAPEYVVTSRGLLPESIVGTKKGGLEIVSSTEIADLVTQTRAGNQTHQNLDDEALLTLAPGSMLVFHKAGGAELIVPHR